MSAFRSVSDAMTLWQGLCLYADAYQIHGRSSDREQLRGFAGSPTIAMMFDSVPIESDWATYAIIDQLVWRVPDSKDPKGVGLFGRVIGAPTEQNLVDFTEPTVSAGLVRYEVVATCVQVSEGSKKK